MYYQNLLARNKYNVLKITLNAEHWQSYSQLFQEEIENDSKIDLKISLSRALNKYNTFHFEDYIDYTIKKVQQNSSLTNAIKTQMSHLNVTTNVRCAKQT